MSSLVKRHELYKISPDPSLPKRGRSNSPFVKGGLRGIFNGKGFTLIELVMVITLMGIIAGVIALPLYQGTMGWFQATTREGITESGRIAMERMMREIRNTARTGTNPCISGAAPNSITFGNISGACNTTTFSFSAPNIQRTDASGTFNLADNVESFSFTYYDKDNGTPAATSAIRRVAIEIVSTRGGETASKYSEVYLSNMRGY